MTASDTPSFYDGRRYDVEASVGYQMFRVMSTMKREVEQRMAAHGLTDAQWRPLWMLRTGKASTAIELARETGIDAGAVTRMVDRLESRGLVERVRSEEDRRVVHLRLTPEGETAVAAVPQVLAAVNNDFLRGFSRDEFEQLKGLLRRMRANGEALGAAEEAA